MKRAFLVALVLSLLGSSALRADFSYVQTSKVTGGMMAGAMKMAGVFSKKAREPMVTTMVLKGDRMAQITGDTAQITDLAAETMTTVDFKRKRYSVVTFEQIRQYFEQMAKEAEKRKKGNKTEIEVKLSVEETGKTREIEGKSAREHLLSLEIEGADPQSGSSGTMEVLMRSWMASPAQGYGEVRDYFLRYAQKMQWMPGAATGVFTRSNQGAIKGIGQIQKEASKLEGMPLLQVMSMGPQGYASQPQPSSGKSATAPPGDQDEPKSVKGSLGKGLGGLRGLGGFGRKKKKKQEDKKQAQQQPPAEAQASGSLMEMTITYSDHSAASVDSAKVDTAPTGFKLVKSDIEKALSR